MQNYNEIVSQLRVLARDLLRMRLINAVRTSQLEAQNGFDQLEKESAQLSKELAVNAYETGRLDVADPRYEDQKKSLEARKTRLDERTVEMAKTLELAKKDVADIQKHIAEIEAGEVKVSMEDLENETAALIREVVKTAAATVATS